MERLGSIINRVLDDVANDMDRRKRIRSEGVAAVEEAISGEHVGDRVQRRVNEIVHNFTDRRAAE
jgi:hypothetical protein